MPAPKTQAPHTLPKNFCFVGEGGWYRAALELEFLGEQNELIKAAANAIPVDLFNVALSPAKQPIHLRVAGPNLTSYTQLTHLNLDTWWRLFEKGTKMHACWGNIDASTCSQKSLRWVPPADMGLFYISRYEANNWTSSFLVAVRKGVEKYYRLPTGNVNSAGHICMGRQFRSNPEVPLIERICSEVESFLKTTWNTDLLGSDDTTHKVMFSFLADGSAQVPIPPNWEKHCQVINATVYNGLPFQKVIK